MATDMESLDQAIQALQQRMTDALPGIVAAAADVLESEIQPRMPVNTGKLASALDTTISAGKRRASATVQVEQSSPDQPVHYAIFKEYGTAHMPAEPFFRPGVEAAQARVLQTIEQRVKEVISDK